MPSASATVVLCLTALVGHLVAQDQARDKKKDPEAIGDRNVAGKVNWYSIEKEMALGKQYAQQVERAAKIVDDPVISEYVNRIGQNLVRNSEGADAAVCNACRTKVR